MPVRGSNLVEEAEKRKESILQKIKAVNVKPHIPYDNNLENQNENSYQENEEEIRKNSIKVRHMNMFLQNGRLHQLHYKYLLIYTLDTVFYCIEFKFPEP